MPTSSTIDKSSKPSDSLQGAASASPRAASARRAATPKPHAGGRLAAAPRQAATVAVVGAGGYTGAVLAELLLRHPSVAVTCLASGSLAGQPVASHLPRLRTDLAFCTEAEVRAVDVAFICTPHGRAAPVVRRLLETGARVVDLSADFRLDPEKYAEWYGEHPCPEMLPAVYGLTELHRAEIAAADLVANPGCYPTAALLALEPLKRFGLLDVVIDAKSGVSGAGKTPTETTHFCNVDSDLVAYGMPSHRHYPEIATGLADAAAGVGAAADAFGAAAPPTTPPLTFVPHLVPLQRGIVETIYVRLGRRPLPSVAELREAYLERYAGEPFVAMCDAPPRLRDVTGTNGCRIHVDVDGRSGRVIVVAAIDNLMKGASGQAVQNMNVMLGLPETEGLL